ncbi:hypothetical protein B9Z55_028803 [Caenorhabditis nigoni]|uniref:Uncharacterized protein n=1 Tax=Caenorhabditis nigoni TaxID=1611254 RepID=A0A2G5SAC9_9PELO|nr:hypothetical protein B9Z55_028803 [Caenorhabditis nigoni]
MLKWMADNEVASIGHTPATCKFTRLLVKKILGKMETSSFGARWRSQVLEEARQSSGINSARVYVPHPSARDLKGKDPVKRLFITINIDVDCTEYRVSLKLQNVITCLSNVFLIIPYFE